MLNRNALKWDEMVRRHFFSGSDKLWGIDKVSTHVLGHLEWKLVETFAVTMNCPLNGTFISFHFGQLLMIRGLCR